MPKAEAVALWEMGRRMELEPECGVRLAAELLRVRDREGRLRPLLANPAQRRYEQRRGRENIVLKARQMGMTTWVAGRFFLRTVGRRGAMTLLVAHTREAAESIFRVVQRMWEELPEELRTGALERSRANAWQMVFPEIDAEFRVGSACDESVGRGLSLQNLHCSEVSRWPGNAAATLAGLRASLVPGGELVLESTPNGAYGAFYEEWRRGTDEAGAAGGLVRHFLPWWLEEAYTGPAVGSERWSEAERELARRHGLSERQIGFRRELERRFGGLRSQEFAEDAETCFRATGSCCFEVEAIERRMGELGEPLEARRGGALLVWYRPRAGREYVVAVDAAGGGAEGDFAAVQVVDRATGLQCAEVQERLRPEELARVAAELAGEYGGAEICVERNNQGAAVLAYLEASHGYARLWRDAHGEAGWLTTASSKAQMVAGLGVLLREQAGSVCSRRLLAECRTFVSGVGGRTGAAPGRHDDLVMAMAVAQAVRSLASR